jgi:hypothetical protein
MKRRAVGLVLAMLITTLTGAAITLMTFHAGRMMIERRNEAVRTYAQVLLDSGMAYARTHAAEVRNKAPAAELALPTEGLLPPSCVARLSLRVQESGAIRIRAAVELGRVHATEEGVLQPPTKPIATTSPVTWIFWTAKPTSNVDRR